jgi:hypothetical protein
MGSKNSCGKKGGKNGTLQAQGGFNNEAREILPMMPSMKGKRR